MKQLSPGKRRRVRRVNVAAWRRPFAMLVLLLPLAVGPSGFAVTYYVSATLGSDHNSGRSPARSWKTLGRVNRQCLKPGDRVLLRRGDLWRETLKPRCSGAAGKAITFGAFGQGESPAIDGSDPVDSGAWLKDDQGRGFIRQVSRPPASLWGRAGRMVPVSRIEDLRDNSQWFYDSVIRRIYLTTPPPTLLEIQARDFSIDNNQQSHVVYDGLTLRRARQGLHVCAWTRTVSDISVENSLVYTEPREPRGTMSAGVYANALTGTLDHIVIRRNRFVPYPQGLEHWGVYFVRGVTGFEISGNRFGPAGEDAITVWHSAQGVISGNRGGGNGENTIDVKDSHHVRIVANRMDDDGEYNIVVHAVDGSPETRDIVVAANRCLRAGRSNKLISGIALLSVTRSSVEANTVVNPRQAGIAFENVPQPPGVESLDNTVLAGAPALPE